MTMTIKKLTVAIALLAALGGCSSFLTLTPGGVPAEPKKVIDPDDLPALIEEASYLGTPCEGEEPSRVVQPKVWYASCEMGQWTMVDKNVLESRVVQYKSPHVRILSVVPGNVGNQKGDGRCVYALEYATDYMEREYLNSTTKVSYNFILKLAVNQEQPAATAAECEIQDSDAALAAIKRNWNIDETTNKILGEKRPEVAPIAPTEPQVTNAKANNSRTARPRISQADLERKRIQDSLPGI